MSQGIFGIIDFNAVIGHPHDLLQTMGAFLLKDQLNKGQISQVANSNYILGMKRISDRSINQQEKIAINNGLQAICLFHGEIINYQDLLNEILQEKTSCNGDLDLAIYLYRRDGPQFARKLNGLFSLAILDQRDSSIILLNDRFGMAHQVYWTTIGGRFYFATHLKTLLALPEIKREMDFEALNLFLKYSYIPSPWTIFKGIRNFPLATCSPTKMERQLWNPIGNSNPLMVLLAISKKRSRLTKIYCENPY